MDPSDTRGIGKYINLALILPITMFIGYMMGYGLDALFHTTWIRYVFLLIGSAAGFVELIRELSKGT
jgi:F0F1-type ATP synthase assembly protein I